MFLTSMLIAQTSNIADSLKIRLEQSNDIERIDILNQLGELNKTSDPFKSYSYAIEALSVSSRIKYPMGQILAYEHMGIFFHYTAQYLKALENYFKVNKLIGELDGDSVFQWRF